MINTDQIKTAQKEAGVFLDHAALLTKAANSNNNIEKISALDSNLKLWVEIETNLQNSGSFLPDELKENLFKLSKFVERTTITKGINMDKAGFDCLVNINMQISEGLLEAIKNYMAREEAFSLLKCAIDIANAKDNNNQNDLVAALDSNLKLWVYIKTLASSKDSKLPSDLKENLVKLADYVSTQTFKIGSNLNDDNFKALDSLITTNLQISEGLIAPCAA